MPLYNPASAGGGAPTGAQYVTLATDATLTAERVLTGSSVGPGILLTDAGAGAAITVSIKNEQWGVLAADQAATTITLANSTGMLCAISASATEIWHFEIQLYANGPVAGDYKFGFTVPAGCTMGWGPHANFAGGDYWGPPAAALTTAPNILLIASDTLSLAAGNQNFDGYFLRGFIFGGGSAGNVQLQFAQAAASGTSTLKKGSAMFSRLVVA